MEREYDPSGSGYGSPTMGDMVDPRMARRGRPNGYPPVRRPGAGQRPPGRSRTADMQDANQNGVDDRDEDQPAPPRPRYQPGYGDPASGYGPGGVEHPDYRNRPGPANEPLDTPKGDRRAGITFAGDQRITGDMSGVRGVDPANWGSMDSTKYRALEFFKGMSAQTGKPVTLNNIRAWTSDPRFQQMFPGVTFDGKDRLEFGGMVDPHSGAALQSIDFVLSADPNRPDDPVELYWNDLVNDGGGAAAPGTELPPLEPPGGPTSGTMPVRDPWMDQRAYRRLAGRRRYGQQVGYPSFGDMVPPTENV